MKYGFIGTGNMGGAIARALAKAVPADSIYLSNKTREKAEKLANELGANLCSNFEVAAECDMIFLGVKPQFMAGVLCSLKDTLKERKGEFVLVSMAAALTINDIKEFKIKGIDRNKNIVVVYIGCLTIPYKPVSTNF